MLRNGPGGLLHRLGQPPRPAHDEAVRKIRRFLEQEGQVARPVYVLANGQHRPEGVIHPDPDDVVSVRPKLSGALADDGGVGAIRPHASAVGGELCAQAVLPREQQSEAVLPEVAPAAAPAAVVVVRQEGTAEDAPEHRLHTHPAQEQV